MSFWEWLITVLLVDLLPFVSPAVALYDVLTKRVDNSKCLRVALIIICCWMRVGGAHLPLAAKKLLGGGGGLGLWKDSTIKKTRLCVFSLFGLTSFYLSVFTSF